MSGHLGFVGSPMSTDSPRWVLHLDMDAFFAAIEQRDDPALRGRAVVVGALPGGRGVVATCSYEARAFGLHSAMPINEAHRLCPQAVYLRPRIEHYRGIARQIRAILGNYSPRVEPVSIDEAYLDVSGLEGLIGPPQVIGQRLKAEILATVGLTASVGIGPNRLVAKLASDFHKPDGLTLVPPERVLGFLGDLPLGVLRGLGSKTLPKLQRLGLRRVADLRALSLEQLQVQLGARSALSLYQQARGIASDRVEEGVPRQSLSKETTFPEDVSDPRLLQDTLGTLAEEVARSARGEGIAGARVTLKVRFQGFETHTRQQRLPQPSDDARTLLAVAWSLFEGGRLPKKPVRLIGLGISGLGPPPPVQGDLFTRGPERGHDSTEDRRLNATLDRINQRFGAGAVRRGNGLRHNF
jgi:DNA polymerase IV